MLSSTDPVSHPQELPASGIPPESIEREVTQDVRDEDRSGILVSTTTSNFMIGVTAAASAGVYLNRGYIDPGLAMPVMLGVLLGSSVGARLLMKFPTQALRMVFTVVIIVLALEMIHQGLGGRG